MSAMKDYDSALYKTHDLALAAAMAVCGFSIIAIERPRHGGKAIFVFNNSLRFNEIVQSYWADKLRANPKTYFDTLRHIKTRLYSET